MASTLTIPAPRGAARIADLLFFPRAAARRPAWPARSRAGVPRTPVYAVAGARLERPRTPAGAQSAPR
jgi:hypothetical protein